MTTLDYWRERKRRAAAAKLVEVAIAPEPCAAVVVIALATDAVSNVRGSSANPPSPL